MSNLIAVSTLVKSILGENKQARNSDNMLYLKVLENYGACKGIDIDTMTVPTFLNELDKGTFPGFETVRRSRQKVQESCPELASDNTTRRMRKRNEDKFREFARTNMQNSNNLGYCNNWI